MGEDEDPVGGGPDVDLHAVDADSRAAVTAGEVFSVCRGPEGVPRCPMTRMSRTLVVPFDRRTTPVCRVGDPPVKTRSGPAGSGG
ncbi:MAG: hypothetical protein M3Q47_13145 [Actinomycetota bacterium]|nr:hypothetical protein [Actinomycetota bacterium]